MYFKPRQIDVKIILLLVVVIEQLTCLNAAAAANQKSGKCPATRHSELDVCASKLGFLGDHSFTVPKNQTAMGDYCEQIKQSISCIQSYMRDCLQGFTRQLLNGLLKRGKEQYSQICQSEQSRRNFMKRMECLSDEKIDQFHVCMDASISRFEFIARSEKSDARLLGLCCSYQIFNRDLDASLSKICGQPAKRAGSVNEYINKIVGGTAGEFFSLICDGHRSLDECRQSAKTSTLLNQLEDVTHRVNENKLKPRHKSLIPVLLEILENSEAS